MFATLQGRGAIGHCLRTDRGLEKRAREERGRSCWVEQSSYDTGVKEIDDIFRTQVMGVCQGYCLQV